MSKDIKEVSEFKVDTSYRGYVFLGWAQGIFETDRGRRMPYYNMFVISPPSTFSSDSYESFGLRAEKKKCMNADVWQGLSIGDKVRLFFDDKGRVISAALDGDSAGGQ